MSLPPFDPTQVPTDDIKWLEVVEQLKRFQVGSLPEVHVRKELSDLAADEWQFNLFVLAMAELMVQPAQDSILRKADLAKDYLSYFHLAGMHGLPAVDWAGVPQSELFDLLQAKAKLSGMWYKPDNSNAPPDDFTFKQKLNIGLEKIGLPSGGYCVHGSPLFMAWHRPYLALIEQILVYTAREIAKQYNEPDRTRAMQAAEQLQFPFWDFSRPTEGDPGNPATLRFYLPPPMSMKFVRVKKPGSPIYEHIENPLYSFKYPDEAAVNKSFPEKVNKYAGLDNLGNPTYTQESAGIQLMNMIKTQPPNAPPPYYSTRNPSGQTKTSDHELLNKRLNETALVQRMRLYYTLTFQQDYVQASCSHEINGKLANSNEREMSPWGIYTSSLENIHDDYHNLLGGWRLQDMGPPMGPVDVFKWKTGFDGALPATNFAGTFTQPETAGFDPSFWFMHCFWEYAICLWQTIHRGSYWEDDTDVRRNADNCSWLRSDSLETLDTPLLPFRKPPSQRVHSGVAASASPKDDYWTARTAQDWTKFGYTFPDLAAGRPKTAMEAQANQLRAKLRVNDLYGFSYDPKVYAAATDPSRYDGGHMFDIIGAWKPPDRKTEDVVKKYYKIINYKTQPWYPKLKDQNGKFSDVTKFTELLVDVPPPQPVFAAPNPALNNGGNVTVNMVNLMQFSPLFSENLRADSTEVGAAAGLEDGLPSLVSTTSANEIFLAAAAIQPRNIATAPSEPHISPVTVHRSKGSKPGPARSSHNKLTKGTSTATGATPPSHHSKPKLERPDKAVRQKRLHTIPGVLVKKGHESGPMRQWKFHFEVEKFGLKGPFNVHVFIGDFPASSTGWEACTSHVHASSVWIRSLDDNNLNASSCGNCNRQYRDKTVYGDYVPLTAKLLELAIYGTKVPNSSDGLVLQSMNPEHVIPFLKRNLHWRILDIHGNKFARADTPGLITYVTSRVVEAPSAPDALPVWHPFEVHHEVTHERPSGLCHPNESSDTQHDDRSHPRLAHIAASHVTI